ncbi:centromere protein X isoform X1 [Chelonia mydas]|uniref:centromere protein X isoform X1 n=1 Tax=Chelonia mydas TaxID=8469 RepID=UPI001CA9750A|nr:centromere protein X isoform X1 [Chelonia mydas]
MRLSPETPATHVRGRVPLRDYSSHDAARSRRPAPPRGRCRMEKRAESASGFRKVRGRPGLYEETVNKILHLHFKDDKTRVSNDALLLMAEMLNVFVREAAARGARQAQAEDLDRVDIEHVEKVLPQLALDLCISEVMFSGPRTPFTPLREANTNINSTTTMPENQRLSISTGSHNRV